MTYILFFTVFLLVDAVAFAKAACLGSSPWWAFLPGGGFVALIMFGTDEDTQND